MGKAGLKTMPLVAADARAVAYAAVAKAADKRFDRDQLLAGAAYPVDLVLSGKVGRRQVKEAIAGILTVGEDGTRNASAAAKPEALVAAIAAALSKPERDRLFKKLRDVWRDTGALPSIDETVLGEAAALVKELRSVTVQTVRGSVSFQDQAAVVK